MTYLIGKNLWEMNLSTVLSPKKTLLIKSTDHENRGIFQQLIIVELNELHPRKLGYLANLIKLSCACTKFLNHSRRLISLTPSALLQGLISHAPDDGLYEFISLGHFQEHDNHLISRLVEHDSVAN